ncbi:MAG TPA: esterase-like activity of phytase family protein [Phenylobacterium sp.]
MRWLAGFAAALALCACAPSNAAPEPPVPVAVTAKPVGQWLAGSEPPVSVGTFLYAGGLELSAAKPAHFGGLSDLDIQPDGRLLAVSDEGQLVRGAIVLDAKGRLTGAQDFTSVMLGNLTGGQVSGAKRDSDSESLALWPNGDLMIGFEDDHRIWLYPAGGGAPHAIPKPDTAFSVNDGMEAIALDPTTGRDAYLVGREDTRETWTCRLTVATCAPRFVAGKAEYGKLVSARPLPGGRWALLFRDFSPLAGVTTHLQVAEHDGTEVDVLTIARPATVDNFEGVSALPRPDGSVRFYLISDDNFASNQRTLLLAFDWRPKSGR